MIRFSAGLVVVAIGVLIGGVATSKLSLVYVAIAVSAIALVALAIGVALKRDELFGGGSEHAPADAGANSEMAVGQSADAGHVRGSDGRVRENQESIRPDVPVTSQSAVFAGSAASSAGPHSPVPQSPFSQSSTPQSASRSAAAPPVGSPVDHPALGNPPLGQRRSAFGQAPLRDADSAADWQTRSPQPPWSSGNQARPTWTPKEPASKEPSFGTTPAAPRARGGSDQPPATPAPAARAGSGTAAPSWFDRLNQPVADAGTQPDTDPDKTQPAKTQPPKSELPKSEPPKVEPPKAAAAQAPSADNDTIATTAIPVGFDSPEPAPTSGSAAPTSGSAWSWSDRGSTSATDDSAAATQAAAEASDTSAPDVGDDDDDWPTRYSWLDDEETDEAAETVIKPALVDEVAAADGASADPAAADETVPPQAKSAVAKSAKPEPATAGPTETAEPAEPIAAEVATDVEAGDADAEQTGAAETGQDEPSAAERTDAKLVTVIPGVPRYHDPECILIRFMDEDDIARKSIPEAKAANCTPCAACQPEG